MLFFSSVEADIGVRIGRRKNSVVQWCKPLDSDLSMDQEAHSTGRVKESRRVHRLECETNVITTLWSCTKRVCLQVDGNKLAAGLNDGTLVVWNEDGTKYCEMKRHSWSIRSISWNGVEEKSHLFVTGSDDQVNNLHFE